MALMRRSRLGHSEYACFTSWTASSSLCSNRLAGVSRSSIATGMRSDVFLRPSRKRVIYVQYSKYCCCLLWLLLLLRIQKV